MSNFPDYKDRNPKGWCGDPKRGAAMGRSSLHGDRNFTGSIKIEPVPLDTGGYDSLGTYWGIGTPLWFYASDDSEIQVVVRASSRSDARKMVLSVYPSATVLDESLPGIEDFFREYVTCALQYTTERPEDDSDGCSFAQNERSVFDIAEKSLAGMRRDCEAFLKENAEDIGSFYATAGGDFWLARNHHGTGFWDGGWSEDAGERLTKSSHKFGKVDLYVGADEKIYQSGDD